MGRRKTDHDNEGDAWRRDQIERLLERLGEIHHDFRRFFALLKEPHSLQISQEGQPMGVINGIKRGGVGSFAESFLPAGSALPAGASIAFTWSADDPTVKLTPSADGSGVDADTSGMAAASKSFNLTVSGKSAALPADITSGPVNVPILDVVQLPNALDVNQTK